MAGEWGERMPQRYGDFATWVGSVGTIAAFAVAFVQIHRERSFRKRRELTEWMLAKREHADRVTAWTSAQTVSIANHSHHLIHDVELILDDGQTLSFEHLEPGTTHLPLESTDALPTTATPEAPDAGAPATTNAAPHPARPVSMLHFTDPRGDRWLRAAGKRPHLADAPPGGHTHATAFARPERG